MSCPFCGIAPCECPPGEGPLAPLACRVCGCTDEHACVLDDGNTCAWAEDGLCTACVSERPEPAALLYDSHGRPVVLK